MPSVVGELTKGAAFDVLVDAEACGGGNANEYLRSNAIVGQWSALDMDDAGAGTLVIGRGGTGATDAATALANLAGLGLDGLTQWDEQGGDPSTPAASKWALYFKAGGLHYIDDAGAVIGPLAAGGAGSGDVVGPASAVDGNVASFDTTTGKLIQDSGVAADELVTAAAVISDLVIPCGDGGARGLKEPLGGETVTLSNSVKLLINPGGAITRSLENRIRFASDDVQIGRVLRADRGSGVGAVGFGVRDLYELENDAGTPAIDAAAIDVVWEDASAGAEDASMRHLVAIGGSLTEIMRINKDGLLVNTGDVLLERSDSSSPFSAGVRIRVNNTAGLTNSFAGFWAEADNSGIIGYLYADGLGTGPLGTPGVCLGSNALGPLAFCTDNTERARFSHLTGNFLIGKTTDDGQLLQVNGGLSVLEIANLTGDLKIMPDVQGDVVLFGDTDVDDAAGGKALIVHRKAVEGDSLLEFNITASRVAFIHTDTNLVIQVAAGKYIRLTSKSHLFLDLGDNAGANELRIRDSDAAVVASIDSDGNQVLEGSLAVDTINETTGAAGVTIEGVLLKDSGILIAAANKIELRDTDIFMHSDADGSAIFESDGSLLLRGLTTTTIGVLGDLLMGGATPTVWYPATDAQVSIGREANQIADFWMKGTATLAGDLLFTGAGLGMVYGEIHVAGNTVETVISLSGKANRVKVAIFDTNGPSNNTTPDQANNQITIDKAGVYFVTCCIHADSTTGGAAEFGWSIYKNGSTELDNLHSHRDFAAGGGGEAGSANICGIVDLAATDVLALYCWNVGGTENVVNADIGISVLQIGGT